MPSLTTPQLIYLAIAAIAFGLLITDKLRVDLVGILIVIALALTGLLSPEQAFSGLGSEPALVIAAIFVLSRGLQLTGVADMVTGWIVRMAGKADPKLIASVKVFDVYRGPGVGEGKKSVAVEVTIQPRGEALKDAEIETIAAGIVASVAKATGATLRG